MFKNKHKAINLTILFIVFLISIIIRLPNLNRPLSRHHEWLTSFSLRIITIFYDNGAYKYNFNPITTYEGSANKNIDNTASLFMPKDTQGNYYYTSYLPFAYLFPYFIFKLIDTRPTILGLQIFNLIFHFISAYFIFLIVSLLNKNTNKGINWPAILGFTIYIFLPLNLWFHSNIYMAEIFVQPLFIIEIYLFLKILFSESIKDYYYWLLGITNLLIVYTEWLGVLLAGTMGLYLLFKIKNKKYKKILYIIVITSIFPLLLTIYQYSKIAGFEDLILSYKNKYSFRSGFSNSSPVGTRISDLTAWAKLTKAYLNSFFPFFLILLLSLLILFQKFKKISSNHQLLLILYITMVPVMLHHFIFFSGTVVHDFFLLKDSVYIAIFGALIYQYFARFARGKNQLLIFSAIILVGGLCSALIYNKSNSIYSTYYKIIGEKIKQTAKEDEIVFIKFDNTKIKQIDIIPQYIIYAQRNISLWENNNQAAKLIKLNKLNKGVIFTINNNYNISNINQINLLELPSTPR